MKDWIGLDIGGANIKWATSGGRVGSVPFPLWKQPEKLASQLAEILASIAKASLAVTMTGELADCFASRKSGVAAIVHAVIESAGERNVYFYDTDGQFRDADGAIENWLEVAASNWHATAHFSSRLLEGESGYLIDIGSTTTDLIPIKSGLPISSGKTDFDRLRHHELLYLGVRRTPICSLCDSFLIGGQRVPAAREFFATVEDALILTGSIAESPASSDTADGRPAIRKYAAQRLARMVCNDADVLGEAGVREMAAEVRRTLVKLIEVTLGELVQQHPELPKRFVLAGQGEWLAREVIRKRFGAATSIITWNKSLSPAISEAAAAYSVMQLAREWNHHADSNSRTGIRQNTCNAKDPVNSELSKGWLGSSETPPPARAPLGAALRSTPATRRPLPRRVIKLGGSLLDWPEARQRIKNWLDQQSPATNCWIVGGGELVNQLRSWNEQFPIDQTAVHWMCVDLMSITANLLQQWFPEWPLVDSETEILSFTQAGNLIFDSAGWLRGETELPTDWSLTSDSISAHVANRLQADELVLLKSCNIANPADLEDLASQQIVDAAFPEIAKSVASLRFVNLRQTTTKN